jgi:CheY-like chemotaxis protein
LFHHPGSTATLLWHGRCSIGSVGGIMKVLIVDDEINLVRNILGYLGSFSGEFELQAAHTGEDALKIVAHQKPDLLLTDVRLPGMDGIELLRRALETAPSLQVIVMTAFSSPEIRRQALGEGAIRFIEKPLDLDELLQVLRETAETGSGWSGLVGGLDIFDIAQLQALTGRSNAIRVASGSSQGVLVFQNGNIVHVSTGNKTGEEAFFQMAGWRGGKFDELPSKQKGAYSANVQMSTTHLIMEAARLRDEARKTQVENHPQADAGEPSGAEEEPLAREAKRKSKKTLNPSPKEVRDMALKDHLQELTAVEGFKAAAAFSSSGEMLEHLNASKIDIKAVGILANNALLNSQKATDAMGVGRGNMVQIRAPQATVVMRCLNEATDFAQTASGKAHVHMVVVLEPEGNVGMAQFMIDKVILKLAEELR